MIEFKDIVGLSKPLQRLIEVIAAGIGGVSRPLLTRINARAKAYEIRAISEAIAESQKSLGPVKYQDGQISIESAVDLEQGVLPDATPEQRIRSRVLYQEAKKQLNIEKITQYAADELRDEEKVATDKPDSDWTTRFFRIAEDITTDEMQILWGKVLAGEVKRPGSYSLRTLDLLKNITTKEAELFVRVGRIAVDDLTRAFVPNSDDGQYLEQHFGLTFLDFLKLREIGLLLPNDLLVTLSPVGEGDERKPMTCGSTVLVMERAKGTPEQSLRVIVFTEIGRELLQFVEKSPMDLDYMKRFASCFRREGVTLKSGPLFERQADGVRHGDLLAIPD